MPRLQQLDSKQADSWTRKLFAKIEENLGVVPNMFKCMGNSAVAMDGFMGFNGSLHSGKLGPKYVKMVILATSELNGCGYCASAHTQMAKNAELLTDEECLNTRRLIGVDERSQAMLNFVKRVHETKGRVEDQDLQALKEKDFSDEEVVEILGAMALITFANYISNVGKPDLDFPPAPKA
jgi:uncharacterized peroxidase-related enzyme